MKKNIITVVIIAICVIMLGLMISLNIKVSRLEEDIKVLQEKEAEHLTKEIFFDTTGINGNVVEDIEASDIAEVEILENKLVWDGTGDSSIGVKRVYFTFDDGPSSNTDKILDILEKYGVKATFFVVGKEGYNEQYRRIVADGHTLGMHSYSHKYSEIYESLDAYKKDLMKLHDFLYEITGIDSNIVRFPGGSSNTISGVDMHEFISYLDEQNMIYFDWNVSSRDGSSAEISAEEIADNVLSNIDRYNNVVVLFHDASGKASTVEALPIIIEKILESDDTVFLPISDDTVRVQHLH